MKNDFVIAITQLSAEKNLDADTVFEAVEAAIGTALKKDELQYADIKVSIDQESGDIESWRRYEVMDDDDIEDDEIQVSPERAAKMGHAGASVGDFILEELEQDLDAGRIAAQTAKQVVLQRLREAEREAVFEEFSEKEGDLVSGTVLRVEPGRRQVIIDLGRTEAVLPGGEQVRAEHYRVGQRIRVYVKEIYRASKGPQVVVSRSHPDFLRRLFELEVPEAGRGAVEIMGVARDPGYRTKIAVISRQAGIDPIGALLGVRGARIQNVINELGGERIDVIRWDPNDLAFTANALSPAEVVSIRLDEETNTAYIAVPDKQLSLAIGKEGQNARLAAKLTGHRIDIRAESVLMAAGEDFDPPPEPSMDAIPVDRPIAERPELEMPLEVAPSQAVYARPGLPGEGGPPTPQPPQKRADEPQLTPEQEVLAALSEPEPEPEQPAATLEPEPAPSPDPVAKPTSRAGGTGLRFAEEIRELTPEDEDDGARPARKKKRRGGGGGGGGGSTRPARPARQQGVSRRFEASDEDIEEGLGGIGEAEDDWVDPYAEYAEEFEDD